MGSGFSKMGSSFIHHELRYMERFKIREDGFVAYVVDENFITKVQYLHQLQNLIYALTGQELEIDL